MGRPTDYTEELVNDFCSRIALGRSLRSVVGDDEMEGGSQGDKDGEYYPSLAQSQSTHLA